MVSTTTTSPASMFIDAPECPATDDDETREGGEDDADDRARLSADGFVCSDLPSSDTTWRVDGECVKSVIAELLAAEAGASPNIDEVGSVVLLLEERDSATTGALLEAEVEDVEDDEEEEIEEIRCGIGDCSPSTGIGANLGCRDIFD